MSEQLKQIIQEAGQNALAQNSQIPAEHSEAIINEAHQSVAGGLQRLAESGELSELAQNPQALASHPAVQGISNNFMQNIMAKFGLSKLVAGGLATSLIPMVMGKLSGGGQLGSLLSSLTGGAQQGAGGALGNLSSIGASLGLDKDGDGSVGLSDLGKLI